jgi:acetolactate synthase-1/2/3 large subunit
MTIADLLASRLARAGTRAVFGVPGGGSSLDIIDACARSGLRFVLAHTETGGAIMAAAQAEITGAPGVCLSTLGPGVSSIVNGVAHAHLDRVPLLVLTDALDTGGRDQPAHQHLPHAELLAPVTRYTGQLSAARAAEAIDQAIAHATGPRPGPVHLDCSASVLGAPAAAADDRGAEQHVLVPATDGPGPDHLSARAEQLLRRARRPLVIVGLGAGATAGAALLELCAAHRLPVLTTYKAKGVLPDGHCAYAGLFTLGEFERPFVERADLVMTVGLDAVELLPRPWGYTQPVLHFAETPPGGQVPVGEVVSLPAGLIAAGAVLHSSLEWSDAEIAVHRERERAAVLGGTGLTPGEAVLLIGDETRAARHVTVDAGAHMFPAMTLVPAPVPRRILISNGLSTMGFAVPAAIGAALLAPAEPVVAITGDAGLLMCLGELQTAAREGLHLVVVVVADGELSLIRVKQERRGLPPAGVRIGAVDWRQIAAGMGFKAARATDSASLRGHTRRALETHGPSLIEVPVDPAAYGPMLRCLRG